MGSRHPSRPVTSPVPGLRAGFVDQRERFFVGLGSAGVQIQLLLAAEYKARMYSPIYSLDLINGEAESMSA